MRSVLDASALLSLLLGEPGASEVRQRVREGAIMSAVNFSEVLSKLADRGVADDRADHAVSMLRLDVRAFDMQQARRAARLRAQTRHVGLSLGDRACLALALEEGLPVVTADRVWASLSLGVSVQAIR